VIFLVARNNIIDETVSFRLNRDGAVSFFLLYAMQEIFLHRCWCFFELLCCGCTNSRMEDKIVEGIYSSFHAVGELITLPLLQHNCVHRFSQFGCWCSIRTGPGRTPPKFKIEVMALKKRKSNPCFYFLIVMQLHPCL